MGYVDHKYMNNKQITNNKTYDKRNPLPLIVSLAPERDEGPTVYIQIKERKSKSKIKNNLFYVQIIILVGGQILRYIGRTKKHILIYVVEQISEWKTNEL
jgi:hypothetical protein